MVWRTVICDCKTGIYAPPSYDYFQPPGTSDLYMIATAGRSYPTATLLQSGLPGNALTYLPDFFQGLGRWSGVVPQVLPEGWADYLKNQGNSCDDYLGSGVDAEGVLELGFRTRPGLRYQLERSLGQPGNWVRFQDPVPALDNFHVVRIPMEGAAGTYFRFRILD